MAGRAVSRVFVVSRFPYLAKHLKNKLPALTVEDLHYKETPGPSPKRRLSDDMVRRLGEAEVILADPYALAEYLNTDVTRSLKWAQSTAGGIDHFMRELNFKKPAGDFILTRSGDAYGDIMGQYVLAQIIARERDFAGMRVDQDNKVFDMPRYLTIRPLSSVSIAILGYGAIGKRVAEMCKFMGMTVWAVTRTHNTTPSPSVDHFRQVERLGEVLQHVDYLCSILTDSPSSRDLLSGDILKQCQDKKTVLINIGRGSVINDDSLVRAIREGWLGGAILDVFNQEPLPAHSPLWTLPGVTITPHASGPTLTEPVVESFVKNLKLYESGQPLQRVVDWEKGY